MTLYGVDTMKWDDEGSFVFSPDYKSAPASYGSGKEQGFMKFQTLRSRKPGSRDDKMHLSPDLRLQFTVRKLSVWVPHKVLLSEPTGLAGSSSEHSLKLLCKITSRKTFSRSVVETISQTHSSLPHHGWKSGQGYLRRA